MASDAPMIDEIKYEGITDHFPVIKQGPSVRAKLIDAPDIGYAIKIRANNIIGVTYRFGDCVATITRIYTKTLSAKIAWM